MRILSVVVLAAVWAAGACVSAAPAPHPQTTVLDQTPTCPTCPPPPGPYEFYPPSGFIDEHIVAIKAAAAELDKNTNADHKITFSERGTRRILAWYPEPLPRGYLAGQWLWSYGVMLIRPGETEIFGISLHEFGHALGMHHIASPGSVMCGQDKAPPGAPDGWCGPSSATTLTADDRRECARVGACDDPLLIAALPESGRPTTGRIQWGSPCSGARTTAVKR